MNTQMLANHQSARKSVKKNLDKTCPDVQSQRKRQHLESLRLMIVEESQRGEITFLFAKENSLDNIFLNKNEIFSLSPLYDDDLDDDDDISLERCKSVFFCTDNKHSMIKSSDKFSC